MARAPLVELQKIVTIVLARLGCGISDSPYVFPLTLRTVSQTWNCRELQPHIYKVEIDKRATGFPVHFSGSFCNPGKVLARRFAAVQLNRVRIALFRPR